MRGVVGMAGTGDVGCLAGFGHVDRYTGDCSEQGKLERFRIWKREEELQIQWVEMELEEAMEEKRE